MGEGKIEVVMLADEKTRPPVSLTPDWLEREIVAAELVLQFAAGFIYSTFLMLLLTEFLLQHDPWRHVTSQKL